MQVAKSPLTPWSPGSEQLEVIVRALCVLCTGRAESQEGTAH